MAEKVIESRRERTWAQPKLADGTPSTKKLLGVYNIGENIEKQVIPPKPEGATRFVCLSDTHDRHSLINVPPGDVLLHAGDFSFTGSRPEVERFNEFLRILPHKYKVVIAGNHEVTFEEDYYHNHWRRYHKQEEDTEVLKSILKDCIYLEDTDVVIEGFRIYGSPWQPAFCNWAFNLERGKECQRMWDRIPTGTDILITHGPPHGKKIGKTMAGIDAGCEKLSVAIQRTKPRVHLSGHIHEGYGITQEKVTTYINASICTLRYKPTNNPIVFDMI